MNITFDDDLRAEAARRIARRGPRQRARLLAALDLPHDAFDDQLSVDVPLDDLESDDDAGLPEIDLELGLGA